jgi:cytochrome c oxidase subunit IV
MEEKKGADPKHIVAIQMLSIGVILLILGLIVFFLSPIRFMAPYFRISSLISNTSIILAGLGFAIGGFIRLKRLKKA